MKKLLRKLKIKQRIAGVMAVILTTMAFLPYIPEKMVSFADYAQTIEPAAWKTWDSSFYKADADAYKEGAGLTPTGLMYENKVFHLGDPVEEGSFPAGAKQYLVENKQHSDGSFNQFDKTFLYCVQGHSNGIQIYLGSQAFFEKYWTVDDMPEEFPIHVGGEDRRKFNFLMNVYGSYMGRNDSLNVCNDENAGTAKYIVAATINWIAADDCGFTGNWGDDVKVFRGKKDYQAVMKQMNPNAVGDRSVYNQLSSTNIPKEYKDKGCENWAEYMLRKVWEAATITKKLHVDDGKTVYYATTNHSTDTYTVTVPYPSDAVKEYYQKLSAKELYGDWTYTGSTDAGLVFTSLTGEVPPDGSGIATLYPSQADDALAKDLGSAQLATFKFYTKMPDSYTEYTFRLTQTFFVAKLDDNLEIHVRVDSPSIGVKRYKHTEGFGSNYNIGLDTFDSETGKPLADTHWNVLEKFDDSQLDDTDLDLESPGDYSSNLGSLTGASWEDDKGSDEARISENYSGSLGLNDSEANLYNQGNASGSQFKRWSDPEKAPLNAHDYATDEHGSLHYTDSRGDITSEEALDDSKSYTYEKGYCTGHPAPVIEYEEVPEPEYDEETGNQTNEDDIEAVEQRNQALHDKAWAEWYEGVKACEERVKQGGFFHAIDPTGKTQKEALEKDRDKFYKQFISLKYQYSAKEITPAPGYALHGSHSDDIPMEWRTVTSSEYKDYQSHGIDHTGGSRQVTKEAVKSPILNAKPPCPKIFITAHGKSDKVKGLKSGQEDIEITSDDRSQNTDKVESQNTDKEESQDTDKAESQDTDKEESQDTDKAESQDTDKAESQDTDKEESQDTDKAESQDTDKAESQDTDKAESQDTDKAESQDTDKAESQSTDKAEETTAETQPETTAETQPETTAETQPETTAETQPETTAETQPETTAETQPETTAETQSETTAVPTEAPPVVPQESIATASQAMQLATTSNAKKVKGGITFTGFMSDLATNAQLMTSKVSTMSMAVPSLLKLGGARKAKRSSRSSLSSLQESKDTNRLDLLDSSIKDWTFIAYDHRVEGEIHINKKDMDLKKGEAGSYNAYGDTEGDGTLEGAVYGLFAAQDISHPDGHSGIVYKKDNLVSVATTDRNGDASFMAITQAPGYTYNYQSGNIVKTSDNWADSAPSNLYTSMGTAVNKESDIEQFEGHGSGGGSISLTDSRNETASGYEKLSSNQGRDGTGSSSHSYPIENNEALNGNSWIGRPLIVNSVGTQYYIKELSRSEGYELSVYGKDATVSNKDAYLAGGNPSAEGTVTAGSIEVDRLKKINTFTIKSSGTLNGYQIYAKNIPKGATFYKTESKVVENPKGTHTEYVSKEETVYAEEDGARVIINGSTVLAKVGDTIFLPNGESATVAKVSDPEYDYTAARPDNALRYTIPTFKDKKDTENLVTDANAALKKASFKEPDEGAPWMLIPIEGDTFEEQADSLYKGMEDAGLSTFNCLKVDEIQDGNAIIRYSYRVGSMISASVYDETLGILYLKKNINYDINGSSISGYLYVPYKAEQFEDHKENSNGFVTYAKVRAGDLTKLKANYPEDLSTIAIDEYPERTYWVYSKGEPLRNNDGSIKTVMVEQEVQVSPGYELKDVDTPVQATYDGKGYTINVAGNEGTISTDYKIKYSSDFVEGTYTTPEEYAGYYGNISSTPNMTGAGTYIETVTLRYDRNQLYADGGTRKMKVSVEERPILQKIKITKDIAVDENGTYQNNTYAGTGHKDNFTENGGGNEDNAKLLKNFRFKAYLKSNLERLYRAEDGTVIWQDRNGNQVDISKYRENFPQKVQKLYTKVDYETGTLTKDSNKSAIANKELYSYTGDYINSDQNPGYARILESTNQTIKDSNGKEKVVSLHNYKKFFDAIKVANQDKWDRTDNKSTSFKPFAVIKKLLYGINGKEKQYPTIHNNGEIENNINTTDTAKNNALRSDNVRQFAITWYLDDEVAKLVKKNHAGETESSKGSETYEDEVYNQALSQAIEKAENYLKPFFNYDLDEIYAINWDSEKDGGTDKDFTTLSADSVPRTIGHQEDGTTDYCYGISEYLPYGTYVAVEQQPFSKDLGDFSNKHYKTDAPKEIDLPSVYEGGKAGADKTPEKLNNYYNYNPLDTASNLSSKYLIRFNEEWSGENGEDLRKYVIHAHNYLGDYEIYQYGLDIDKLNGKAAGDPSGRGHFTITQGVNDPVKDYYNTMVDTENKGGNQNSHYLADDKNAGKATANGSNYETNGIEKIYHYGSISEDEGTYDNVAYPTDSGEIYKDDVTAMEGMQIAYESKYAPMLVPWSVVEPADEATDVLQNANGTSNYKGYAYRKYRNTFYKSKLRIEKLDSETGENILHDGAIFALYAASRDDRNNTDGFVKFYEKDTTIIGSKEFLTAMGAKNITESADSCSGIVSAGTPICKESEQVILTDQDGQRTGQFEAFTTINDEKNQNTGYLTTPEPLGAGTYVLCEIKPPAGYVRTKPIAIEIYSDKTTYYLDGDRDSRVVAAVYEDQTEEGSQGTTDTARIYVGNTPIRLEVSKIKDSDNTVTYRTDTRLEGTELELKQKYGTDNLEFAYKNGTYLGYAWYKGTLEYLQSRKDAGEDVEPVYIDSVFAGYGLISRPLDTADDTNRYVAGAKMTLYDAIEIKANGDSGDNGYDGIQVTRDRNNNVQSINVLKGYAGSTVEFLRKEDANGSLKGETGDGTWTYETIERGDTDILFYSLNGLKVIEKGRNGTLYGYDREGNKVEVKNQESIYVLKAGRPVFELTGGDLTAVKYSSIDKCFTLSSGTVMYHLDSNGNRDAYVNPTTGMAYTRCNGADPAKEDKKIMVWPVKISKTDTGAVIAREKIKTWRIATIHADTDQEYITGTFDGNHLNKSVNPVLNSHGLPVYYQRSNQIYKKGDPIYDIDGDYVRYKYDDLLNAYNNASYSINNETGMKDIGNEEDTTDDKKLYHRQGESWVMENTWITGEKYPNDPFKSDKSVGQADMLKRIIPGTYIMEEINAPSGYTKGFPEGVTVNESKEVQKTNMEDPKIKVEIVKTDSANQYNLNVKSDYQENLTVTEPKGAYSYSQVSGAHLALYKAKRVYSTDSEKYPKGYYLEKAENTPAKWTVEKTTDNTPVTVTADWITDGTPKYFEGIPSGDYILEETDAASGYVRTSMEVEIKATELVQTFNLKNDHTKLEVYKYYKDKKGKMLSLPNDHAAGLALYEAKTDKDGNIIMSKGKPMYDKTKLVDEWTTDDLTEYTKTVEKSKKTVDRLKSFVGISSNKSNFINDFEAAYKKDGDALTSFTWYTEEGEQKAERTTNVKTGKGESIVQTWTTDTGKVIRITMYRNVQNGSLDSSGKLPLHFEYQFNYKEHNGVKSYDTIEGMHRIDYLPFNSTKAGKKIGNYVLVEEKVPYGFETADPKAIVLTETGDVQRVSLENEEKYINIEKVITDGANEYAVAGAKLALYKADNDGNYVEDKSHLVETWISGSDGTYTKEDKFSDNILQGFTVGALKPHRIDKIPYGTYYIAELEAPAYMQKAAPQKITVGAEKITVYKVINKPTIGKLEIQKKASDTGKGLENARFEVTNKETGDIWYMTTGKEGKADLENLPVGKVQTDGTIKPYTYAIEEISPPDFYQISGGIRTFKFDGKGSGKEILYTCEIENAPTKIHFKKTNFDTGMAVKGAKIAVYEAVAVDGEYQKNGKAIETTLSDTDGFTLTKKLSANHVYIMEELKAPTGYTLSKPVIFTVNKRGTGIRNVSNDFNILKLASDNGSIESLTISGRVPVKVYTILKDLDTGKSLPEFIGTGNSQTITAEDGIKDGHLYEITEYTKYSDGQTEKSFKETKRIYLDQNNTYTFPSRTYLETKDKLIDTEGNVLAEWTVNENNHEYTITNPVTKEIPIAKVTGSVGQDYSAVKKGSVLKYTISYKNPYNHKADIQVKAVLNDGLEYMRSTKYGTELNKIVTWNLTDVAAHESGSVDVVAVVTSEKGTQITADFKTKVEVIEKRTTLKNPIVPDGSITIINKLTGTGKNQTDPFTYHVKFTDQEGNTLIGYQAYGGTKEGRIKGEGDITITGDGFLTFEKLPYGTKYEITQENADGYSIKEKTITGEVEKQYQSAVFTNNRNDETIREILTAGGNYKLTETTTYTDGTTLTSGVYNFQVNASGMVDNVDMEDKPIHLIFSKVDMVTGEELKGGKYSLIDAETNTVIHAFTKEGLKVLIPGKLIIPGKEYIIREEQPPKGYSYQKEIRFKAEDSGIPETIIMQDKQTEVLIQKTDEDTGKLLSGGHFSIKDKETGTLIKTFTASGKPEVLTGLLIAGKTYELIEDEPPIGYAYSQSVTFTVPEEQKTITITMKDKKTKVLVEKLAASLIKSTPSEATSSEATSQLSDCILQVLNEDKTPAKAIKDGNGVKQGENLIFTTGKQFEMLKGQLEAGKNYWIHEVKPKDGYAYAKDVSFTVNKDGKEEVVVLIDDPTHVILSKKAITGTEELPGNHMSVKDKDGNILGEWVSGEQPHEIIGELVAGETYYLCEEKPVDGYTYAKAVSFTVSKNGSTDMVEMKNQMTKVSIRKVNESGQLLKGAILQILDEQKNIVIPNFETTGEETDITGRLVAGKNYYLHEVQAPTGYLLSADVAFTVPKEETLTVTMTDPKKENPGRDINQMYLYKTDGVTGKGIEGAEFTIYQSNGSHYLTVTTDKQGYARFDVPANGTYTYKEIKAPSGYLISDHVYSFTIKKGEVTESSTVLVSDYSSPKVIIKKMDAEKSKVLSGAVLEIKDERGTVVLTGETDANGQLFFNPDHVGKYIVYEKKAPNGYSKTDAYITINISEAGTATGEFIICNNRKNSDRKKGFITASYQSTLSGYGSIHNTGKGFWTWLSRMPRTGDKNFHIGIFILSMFGAVVSLFMVRRKKKRT